MDWGPAPPPGQPVVERRDKVGTKLGGFVDRVCFVRPRLLCGVGSQGEVLWDVEAEDDVHRRKISEHEVHGLVATPDGRALWADGSNHAWVIDPDYPSGYMKLPLRQTSPVDVPEEGIVALGLTTEGRSILAARDGAVAWTNRALRLEAERFPAGGGRLDPLAVAGDARWVVRAASRRRHSPLPRGPARARPRRQGGARAPAGRPVDPAESPGDLPRGHRRSLLLAGPQADDQLGRLWRVAAESLTWEPLRLQRRPRVEEPAETEPAATRSRTSLRPRARCRGPPSPPSRSTTSSRARPSG